MALAVQIFCLFFSFVNARFIGFWCLFFVTICFISGCRSICCIRSKIAFVCCVICFFASSTRWDFGFFFWFRFLLGLGCFVIFVSFRCVFCFLVALLFSALGFVVTWFFAVVTDSFCFSVSSSGCLYMLLTGNSSVASNPFSSNSLSRCWTICS